MSSQLYISKHNPLQFVDMIPTQSTVLYATRHIDDFYFEDQVYKFQNRIPFFQYWINEDIIRLQFQSNYAPINLDLYDQFGRRKTGYSAVATQVRANKYLPGFYVYEATLSLLGLGAGPWRYILTPGNDLNKRQKSEWFTIIRNSDGTIRNDYFNSTYKDEVIYETGIKFSIRIPGYIEYMAPGNKVVVFEDQPLNQTVVSARSFANVNWHVGDGSGVPPWVIRKLNYAAGCDNFMIDSVLFSIVDGKWDESGDPDTMLKGFTIGLREKLNRASKIVTSEGNPHMKIVAISNIDGRLFSDVSANAGETVIQILGQE